MIQSFEEVRIVFDFYEVDVPSLKTSTRTKRGNVNDGARYIIEDETSIDYMSKFLSNILTKKDVTVYLTQKVRKFLTE